MHVPRGGGEVGRTCTRNGMVERIRAPYGCRSDISPFYQGTIDIPNQSNLLDAPLLMEDLTRVHSVELEWHRAFGDDVVLCPRRHHDNVSLT